MATFSALRTAFSMVVTSEYPSDLQVFGTVDEISKAELGDGQDLFGYFTGFRIIPEIRGNTDRTQDFGFYCGELSSWDKSPAENNAIIDRMEAKAKAIVDAFIDSEQGNAMAIQSFSILPYYCGMEETTSGVWCLCEIIVNQGQFC